MNFFGHYCADAKDQNPLYNLGLVYPDLYRDQFKRFILIQKKHGLNPLSKLPSLHEGIKQHIKRDAMFHAASFFKTAENQIHLLFEKYGLNPLLPKPWFIKHVLVELLLDRNLLMRFPQKADAMHLDFEQVYSEHQKTFFGVFSTLEHRIFFNRLAKISKDKYIFAYLNNQMLIKTLYSIYSKVGISMKPEIEQKAASGLEQVITESDNQPWLTWQI